MTNPEIAVAMCVCSTDKLEQMVLAIESIQNQSFTRSVLVIYIDGELQASSRDYLNSLPTERVMLIQGIGRRGLAFGLNVILDEVLSKFDSVRYVARMDSDDVSYLKRLEAQYEYMEQHTNVDVLGAWCVEFDDSGHDYVKKMPSGNSIRRFSCYRSPLVHPTAFIRRRPFAAGFRYSAELLKAQDYDLWSRLMCAGFVFENLQEPLLRYRVSPQMHQRRAGFGLVWRETKMRFLHAFRMKVYSPAVWLKIIGFFVVRISPPAVRVVSYKYLRG